MPRLPRHGLALLAVLGACCSFPLVGRASGGGDPSLSLGPEVRDPASVVRLGMTEAQVNAALHEKPCGGVATPVRCLATYYERAGVMVDYDDWGRVEAVRDLPPTILRRPDDMPKFYIGFFR